MRDIAWPMARYKRATEQAAAVFLPPLVEALATAHDLDGALAVSRLDVGPNLKAAAKSDGIPLHIL